MWLQALKQRQEQQQKGENIEIRDIEPNSKIKCKILVVDKKHSLIMELKDNDSDKRFESVVGLSTYSNSQPTVLSYISIFETLWRQTELHEQLKQSDHIKTEFINLAAHQLRTPIMPIIVGLEVMEDKLAEEKKEDVKKELAIVRRNATRLQNLAEDIMQVSRIESGKFTIKAQDRVEDFNSLILDIVKDIEKKYDSNTDKKGKVSISFVPEYNDNIPERKKTTTTTAAAERRGKSTNSWFVLCDRPKISEVLFNLIDNGMKFTECGTVTIHCKTSYYYPPDHHDPSDKKMI